MAYSSKYRKYSADSEWGELFGLMPSDLTEAQLRKVNFDKLIELMESDERAVRAAGDKLLAEKLDDIGSIKSMSEEDVKSRPYLLNKYNEFVAKRENEIDNKVKEGWNDNRDKWVRWNLLNDSNRKKEIKRTIDAKTSVVNLKDFDYTDWYNKDSLLALDLMRFVVDKAGTTDNMVCMLNSVDHSTLYRRHPELGGSIIMKAFKDGGRTLLRTIEQMPKEVFLAVLPKMFEQPQSIYSYALCHKDTPKKYAIKALRAIGKRRNIPPVKTPITVSMLKELPPVLRLDVLESIMYNIGRSSEMPFPDMDEENLKHILFTTSIRHNRRVDYVVNKFKQLKGENNNEQI